MDEDIFDESTNLLFSSKEHFQKDRNTLVQSEESFICCGLMKWHWMDSYEYRSIDKRNNFFSTVVLLLNAMVGSGLLVQPYAFKSAGIVGISLEYIIFSILTYWGVEILLTAAENHKVYDFGHLVVLSAGSSYGQFVYDLVIVLGGLGSMLSYVFIIQSLSTNIVSNFYSFSSTTELHALKVVVTVVSFIVITPLCLIRNFGHLSRVSFVSMVAVCTTVLAVLVQGMYSIIIRWTNTSTDSSSSGQVVVVVEVFSLSGVFSSLGSVVFAFSFAAALFPALRAGEALLVESPHHVARESLRVTVMLGVLVCFVIGLSGYLSYGSNTQSDILLSFEGVRGILLQAVFAIHLCLVLPADLLVSYLSYILQSYIHTCLLGQCYSVSICCSRIIFT